MRKAVLTLVIACLAGPGVAQTDTNFLRALIDRNIGKFDEMGREIYRDQLEFYATHRDQVCGMMQGTCPPPNKMQGLAIMATKTQLQKRMDVLKEQLIAQLGGDADSRAKGESIFGAIKEGVFADMDRLD